MAQKLPRSVATLFKRFAELTPEEQLLAYAAMRDYLNAGKQIVAVDPVLDEREAALRVMRAVAEHCEVEARKLTGKQFDDAPDSVRGGWKSRRVADAFSGSWKLARNELAGLRPKETAQQRAIRRAAGLKKLKVEDYWTAIREFLNSDPPPPTESVLHYNEWRREKNAKLKPGEMPAPTINGLRRNHHIAWPDAVLIAKGKKTLQQVKRQTAARRAAASRGEHDLVSRADIAEMWGRAESSIAYEANKPGFPTAVLIVDQRRLYLRGDIEAFIAGEKPPRRRENQLRALYLTHREAAEQAASRLGLAARTMSERLPPATIEVGGMQFWLKGSFGKWLEGEGRKRASIQ